MLAKSAIFHPGTPKSREVKPILGKGMNNKTYPAQTARVEPSRAFDATQNDNIKSLRAIWIRLPKTGARCPFTGLSRSALNNLILPSSRNGWKAVVRSATAGRPGHTRGARIIWLPSFDEYVNRLTKAGKQSGQPRGSESATNL